MRQVLKAVYFKVNPKAFLLCIYPTEDSKVKWGHIQSRSGDSHNKTLWQKNKATADDH